MPPANTTSRPAQYKQKSRKGKKSWRKNIDLSDIEKSIEQKKEQEIIYGVDDLSKLKDDALFSVDDTGDEVMKMKLIKRKQIKKKLKSSEILDNIKNQSKINPLNHAKHDTNSNNKGKKVQGVTKKELQRLMKLAGKVDGESATKVRAAKDGLIRNDYSRNELWDDKNDDVVTLRSGITVELKDDIKARLPDNFEDISSTSWSITTQKPKTMDIQPVQVREYKDVPEGGKSYNPDLKEWEQLITKEYTIEKAREDKKREVEQFRKKIEKLMLTIDKEEEDESSSDEENEDENDNDEEKDTSIKLSINEPAKNKKKTKYQRNKAKRHEEEVQLRSELKKLKQQLKDIDRAIEENEVSNTTKPNKVEKSLKKSRKAAKRLGSKFKILDDALEVKFQDEIEDSSLRKLRPEGNLLYDTVRKLQSQGKIESRVRVKRGRRYKQKVTEKWTYKDFK